MFRYNNFNYMPPVQDNLQMLRNQQFQQFPPPANSQTSSSERIWVQGLEGAKAYMVLSGSEVVLWDSEKPYIYIKTADFQGRPNLQVLSYAKQGASENTENHTEDVEYLTKRILRI